MDHDKLFKEYEALVEDLEESGLSRGEVRTILMLKEDIKDVVATYQYRHQVPVACRHEWEDEKLNSTDSRLNEFYHQIGFDRRYEVVLDYCRIEGKYTWCLVGSERFDKEWIESGYATDEVIDVWISMNL